MNMRAVALEPCSGGDRCSKREKWRGDRMDKARLTVLCNSRQASGVAQQPRMK